MTIERDDLWRALRSHFEHLTDAEVDQCRRELINLYATEPKPDVLVTITNPKDGTPFCEGSNRPIIGAVRSAEFEMAPPVGTCPTCKQDVGVWEHPDILGMVLTMRHWIVRT